MNYKKDYPLFAIAVAEGAKSVSDLARFLKQIKANSNTKGLKNEL